MSRVTHNRDSESNVSYHGGGRLCLEGALPSRLHSRGWREGESRASGGGLAEQSGRQNFELQTQGCHAVGRSDVPQGAGRQADGRTIGEHTTEGREENHRQNISGAPEVQPCEFKGASDPVILHVMMINRDVGHSVMSAIYSVSINDERVPETL